jgi:RHS repeat-associated protein
LIDTSRYDAFGKKEGGTGDVDNKYLFAGEQYDEDLSDYYLRARYYDTNSGRFTRRDTYEGSLDDPLTLHKYIYANANPVSFIDPTGLSAFSDYNSSSLAVAGLIAGILLVSYEFSRQIGGFSTRDNIEDFIDLHVPYFESRKSKKETSPEDSSDNGTNDDGKKQDANGGGESELFKKPKSGGTGKEKATDIPSWAKGERPRVNEDGKTFARRLLREKYGNDDFDRGPGSEFNKLRKYGDRNFE